MTRPEKEAAAAWAFSRREIIRDGERLACSRLRSHFHSPSRPRYLNAHVRLYHHREMAYARTIHTPGFETRTNDFAPEHAYFVHLDVLLRDLDERVEKLRRYDRAVPGSSFRFGQHYLPELVPLSAHDPAPLATAEFDALLAALPIKPEVERVTLTTAELRAIHAGPFDRDAFDATVRQHEARVEAQARRLRGPASKPLGELCCTLAQACRPLARSVAPVRRLADRLASFGADLQFRAAARRA